MSSGRGNARGARRPKGSAGSNSQALVVVDGDDGDRDSVQSELDELQRRCRRMELGRRNFTEDSQNAIRMQRQQIEKLKKDNDRLKEDLALETRQARHASNMSASAQIAKLQDQGDMYSRKIAAERRKLDDLDKRIKEMQKAILAQRKEMGGYNASKEKNMKIQKDIRIKENQLDKALVKYNAALAHNKYLRETIENLRLERKVFDGIFKGLKDDLAKKKKQMAEIIRLSNEAYEARDAAQREMVQLKKQADLEQQRFEEKWKQLGNLIEKDRKMKDFIKGDRAGSRAGIADDDSVGDPAEEEEKKLRKRVSMDAAGIEEAKAKIELAKQRVEHYETVLRDIAAATNQPDVTKLVQDFEEAENTNFALFNRVNELSNQIEKMEEQISSLQGEIDKYKGQGLSSDNQRKKILEDLESQLDKTESKAKFYEEKHQEAQSTVSALKKGIQNIFNKIGCSDPSEILGSAGVTESNMMQYLGLIEQRANELLNEYEDIQQASPEAQTPAQPAGDSQFESGAGFNFEAPADEEDGSAAEEEPIAINGQAE